MLQAESVSHHLRVPVLWHRALKPSYACITGIRAYFPHLCDNELVVVGDRILTDVVLANRMNRCTRDANREVERREALAVWTTKVWKMDAMPWRWIERGLVRAARWLVRDTSDPRIVGQFVKIQA